jgi:hypothetical protein
MCVVVRGLGCHSFEYSHVLLAEELKWSGSCEIFITFN